MKSNALLRNHQQICLKTPASSDYTSICCTNSSLKDECPANSHQNQDLHQYLLNNLGLAYISPRFTDIIADYRAET